MAGGRVGTRLPEPVQILYLRRWPCLHTLDVGDVGDVGDVVDVAEPTKES